MAAIVKDERRSLKTLQVSADGKLIGSENKTVKKGLQSKILASKKPLIIYEDKDKSVTGKPSCEGRRDISIQVSPQCSESQTQTDMAGPLTPSGDVHNDSGVGAGEFDQEAYDLMIKDPIPENYWKELAEERRLSLAEALSENEVLHQSMEELKEENQNLSQLAGQAEYLASVLNNVLGDEDEPVEKADVKTESEDASSPCMEANNKQLDDSDTSSSTKSTYTNSKLTSNNS